MTILALDASGPACSVALMRDGVLVAEMGQDAGLTHSEVLMPMLDQVLRAARCAPEAVDLVACVAGPGSFTGVRIGACAAKGFAHARGIPCARLNALEVLAMGAFGFDGAICPILDARRGQVYGAAFRFAEGGRPVRLIDDGAMALEDHAARLPRGGRLLFVGDGVGVHGAAVRALLGPRALIAPPHQARLSAAAACQLAAAGGGERTGAAGLLPIYLRASQAERERLEGAARPAGGR